jgi:hypothetical protein
LQQDYCLCLRVRVPFCWGRARLSIDPASHWRFTSGEAKTDFPRVRRSHEQS